MKKFILLSLLLPIQLYAVTIPGNQTGFTVVAAAFPAYDILGDMNTYRAKYHLTPLENNIVLCNLAKIRAEEIKTDWSHGQFQKEVDTIQDMDGVFSENLARNFEPKDVVWAWSMSKAGHREAMLVSEMKYGCVVQSGNYYAFEGYTEQINN